MHPRVKISVLERCPTTSSINKCGPQAFEFSRDERQHRLGIEMFSRSAEQIERRHRPGGAHVDAASFSISRRKTNKKVSFRMECPQAGHMLAHILDNAPMTTTAFPSAKFKWTRTPPTFFFSLPATEDDDEEEERGKSIYTSLGHFSRTRAPRSAPSARSSRHARTMANAARYCTRTRRGA